MTLRRWAVNARPYALAHYAAALPTHVHGNGLAELKLGHELASQVWPGGNRWPNERAGGGEAGGGGRGARRAAHSRR